MYHLIGFKIKTLNGIITDSLFMNCENRPTVSEIRLRLMHEYPYVVKISILAITDFTTEEYKRYLAD